MKKKSLRNPGRFIEPGGVGGGEEEGEVGGGEAEVAGGEFVHGGAPTLVDYPIVRSSVSGTEPGSSHLGWGDGRAMKALSHAIPRWEVGLWQVRWVMPQRPLAGHLKELLI